MYSGTESCAANKGRQVITCLGVSQGVIYFWR